MGLTFYDTKIAPSPRRIRIMLALKQVPHDTVEIDMMKGEQLGKAYRAINPDATVPALKLDDGTVLTSVAAIAAWLEAEYPEPALMGKTAMEKAQIAGWLSKIEQELMQAIPSALRNTNPVFKGRALPGPIDYEQIPELGARGMKMIDAFMAELESHLNGKEYVAANQLSVADIAAVCFLDFARVLGKKINDDFPNLKRWRLALGEQAAFTL